MGEFIVFVIVVAVLFGLFMIGVQQGNKNFDNKHGITLLLLECESSLSRNVKCILVAKPE